MELDETLPEAHVVLACILGWSDWDWAASGREWEKAFELSPEETEWRAWYSHYLLIVGRPDEAMRNIERAVELDPIEPGRRAFYSSVLWYARRIDDCIEQARRSLQLAPVNPMAQACLVCAFHEKGQYDEAIKAQIEYYKYVMPDKPDVREALERGYAEEGFAGAFRRAADVEVSRHVDEPNIAWEAANNYMFAGDTAKALDWLEKYVALRGPNAVYIHIDPFWDPVRSDPRFQALLRKMNFPVDEKK